MRRLTLLLIPLLFVWLALPGQAAAQVNQCPEGTYQVTTPGGTWPGTTSVCLSDSNHGGAHSYDSYLCGSWNYIFPEFWSYTLPTLYFVPGIDVGPGANIKFMAAMDNPYHPFGAMPFDLEEGDVTIDIKWYYGPSNFLLWMTTIDLASQPMVIDYWNDYLGLPRPYPVYFIYQETPLWTGINTSYTYFTVDVLYSSRIRSFDLGAGVAFQISSWQANRYDVPFPDYCSLSAPAQPTPTVPPPTPTPTPNGSPTPTPLPTQPVYPTSAPPTIIVTPPPTFTPVTFQQIPAEPTATPWSIPTLANLTFPTPAPINTPEAALVLTAQVMTVPAQRATVAAGWMDDINFIEGVWATPAARSMGMFETWSEPPDDVVITATHTITNPVTGIYFLVQNITMPVRMVKSVFIYAPNLWPLVLAVMISASIMIITVALKFGVGLVATIIEIIRRLWEALPLN